ncbi:coiled-coil domain-containing protein [Metamycoplasma alkalescens]
MKKSKILKFSLLATGFLLVPIPLFFATKKSINLNEEKIVQDDKTRLIPTVSNNDTYKLNKEEKENKNQLNNEIKQIDNKIKKNADLESELNLVKSRLFSNQTNIKNIQEKLNKLLQEKRKIENQLNGLISLEENAENKLVNTEKEELIVKKQYDMYKKFLDTIISYHESYNKYLEELKKQKNNTLFESQKEDITKELEFSETNFDVVFPKLQEKFVEIEKQLKEIQTKKEFETKNFNKIHNEVELAISKLLDIDLKIESIEAILSKLVNEKQTLENLRKEISINIFKEKE